MKFTWPKYILLALAIILAQVLVLNHVAFQTYVNPYLYVFLIYMLPFNTNKTLTLAIAFVVGFMVDVFSDTAGWHAGASVLAMFTRNVMINITKPLEGHEEGDGISVFSLGLSNYLIFTGIIVGIHHFYLFFIESFKWSSLFPSLLKGLFSSVFTLILMISFQYIFIQKKRRR